MSHQAGVAILIAVLGCEVRCRACGGDGGVVWWWECWGGWLGVFLSYPPVPEDPAYECCYASPAYYCDWGDAFLEDAHEADDEYDDRTDMLDDDR